MNDRSHKNRNRPIPIIGRNWPINLSKIGQYIYQLNISLKRSTFKCNFYCSSLDNSSKPLIGFLSIYFTQIKLVTQWNNEKFKAKKYSKSQVCLKAYDFCQKYQKLHEITRISKKFGDRLYRWVTDYNQPINRSFFRRLIGIGRTLLDSLKV